MTTTAHALGSHLLSVRDQSDYPALEIPAQAAPERVLAAYALTSSEELRFRPATPKTIEPTRVEFNSHDGYGDLDRDRTHARLMDQVIPRSMRERAAEWALGLYRHCDERCDALLAEGDTRAIAQFGEVQRAAIDLYGRLEDSARVDTTTPALAATALPNSDLDVGDAFVVVFASGAQIAIRATLGGLRATRHLPNAETSSENARIQWGQVIAASDLARFEQWLTAVRDLVVRRYSEFRVGDERPDAGKLRVLAGARADLGQCITSIDHALSGL